jgi:hypothetical protein
MVTSKPNSFTASSSFPVAYSNTYKVKVKLNNMNNSSSSHLLDNYGANNEQELAETNGPNQPLKFSMKDLNKEERLRIVREKREQELEKRKREIEDNLRRKQELRDKQLRERQKRIDELKQKESEKRAAVEERRRQREEMARMRLNELVKHEQEKEVQRIQKIKQMAASTHTKFSQNSHANTLAHEDGSTNFNTINKSHSAFNLNSHSRR